ncbi:MAG: tRNA (N(6)-L-threonylcarbamoyladenosine(37)-C(2))-methylthiotransferase MtaB [Clostridiaceae bacterium]|jgi:threonylcarbamoyladenosine tRNA methylthiotransferase MtaB|nr:tRNA (N(6)-L-threonylcarbamoyladenosine(37)-C(2))-methylthiotransferase MtaB [Clostridiaceae bacterium]
MKLTKKVAFITLGCKVNIAETEGMKLLFQKSGYIIVDENEHADVYVINTCTVTGMGDKKSRQMIRRAHSLNPDAIIAVVGCFAQVSPEEASKIEGVNLVLGNNMKHRIVELVESTKQDDKNQYVNERKTLLEYEDLPIETYEGHTRAFLKIQDGCDQFCSYCIIPYARGPVRSRDINDVIKEAKNFALHGFKEVVLTGIHLTSYNDKKNNMGLADIIKRIHDVEGIERIRLGSLEPMFLTPEFIEGIKDLPKLCPHFHISLQSGCAETLKRMNRKYSPEDYRQIVKLLREKIPDVTFTTDVMVGFPGETDEEFSQSYDFCREIGFLWIHVFKYSPRKGTAAAKFPNQVEPSLKEKRSKQLIELAKKMRNEVFEQFLGRQTDVILEKEIEGSNGDMEGLTANYIPVSVKIENINPGEIISVDLDSIEGERIRGTASFVAV